MGHAYLIHVIRYIHYNSVDAGLAKVPENWKYSNYAEWIGSRNGTLVDREFIKNYFPSPDDYRQYMEDYTINKEFTKKLERYLLEE